MTISKLEEAFDQSRYEIEFFLASVMDVREESAVAIANEVVDGWSKYAYSAKKQYDASDSDIAFAMVRNMHEILQSNVAESKLQFVHEVNVRMIIRELKKLIEDS